MKKTLIVLGCMSLGLAHAQQGRTHAQHTDADTRVGINTEKPVATLELSKVTGVPATQVQGFLLPHLTQEERNAFTKEALVNGVMIFNTTKNCIDWWDGAHWQCTDSRYKDEHGDEFAKYSATFPYTATVAFTRNNCVAPQTGGSVNYTNPTPIIGQAVSNISEADARTKAEADAKAKFNVLGQAYANANGVCKDPLPSTTAIVLPNGLTIDNGQRIIASIYDTDYMPYNMPNAPASWATATNQPADGQAEAKTIDVQGKVTTTGLAVQIPVTATTSGSIPAYKTYVRVPAERTQDGVERVLELSWVQQSFSSTTKTINATIKSLDGDLNVKQLDLIGGLGSDFKGLELTSFTLPQSAADGNTPETYRGKFELRVISGIPDKHFADKTIVNGEDKGYLHQFIYLPVMGPDGKLWLNNNLGADYANVNSPHFDPSKQAETPQDYKAYGSMFQWGRDGDGHELLNWKSQTTMDRVVPDIEWWSASNPNFALTKSNDPCPIGWHLPLTSELINLMTTYRDRSLYQSTLKLPHAGNYTPSYWTGEYTRRGIVAFIKGGEISSVNSKYVVYLASDNVGTGVNQGYQSWALGTSVRCILDTP